MANSSARLSPLPNSSASRRSPKALRLKLAAQAAAPSPALPKPAWQASHTAQVPHSATGTTLWPHPREHLPPDRPRGPLWPSTTRASGSTTAPARLALSPVASGICTRSSPRVTVEAPGRRWCACTASSIPGAAGSSFSPRWSTITTCSHRHSPGTRADRQSLGRSRWRVRRRGRACDGQGGL